MPEPVDFQSSAHYGRTLILTADGNNQRLPLRIFKVCLLIAAAESAASQSLACSFKQTVVSCRPKVLRSVFIAVTLMWTTVFVLAAQTPHSVRTVCFPFPSKEKEHAHCGWYTYTLRSYAMFIFIMYFSIIYNLLLPKPLILWHPAQFASYMCCEQLLI